MNNFNSFNNGVLPRSNNFAPFYTPTQAASAATNNIVQVQGIEGAKAWQLAPNSMIILLDSEVEGKMYIKVSDNIGMSSLRIFNYVEETPTTNQSNVTVNNDLDLSQFVRKDELSTLIKELLNRNEQFISTAAVETPAPSNTDPAANKPKIITIKK